jgi:hypothetical protein
MKILLLTDHSDTNSDLALLSSSNHWSYSSKHRYDLITLRVPYAEAVEDGLTRISQFLRLYDVVMTFGSDVLFTDKSKRVEDILLPNDSVVQASEPPTWEGKINNGVSILVNTPCTHAYLDLIQSNKSLWLGLPCFHQDFVARNLHHPTVAKALRVVPTRAMNSTFGFCGADYAWAHGDWILHFYGVPDKLGAMRRFKQEHIHLFC